MRSEELRLVTTNRGKLREFRAALAPLGVKVRQVDREYPEIQAEDFAEVARFGVEWLRARGMRDFVLEDAGLTIDALGGFPGVYSKFAYRTVGCEGILTLMREDRNRRARFVSVIAGRVGRETILVRGECVGMISRSIRGGAGFGFDPIFVPSGSGETFAEMTVDRKNAVSHRGNALRALVARLPRPKG